VPDRDITGRLAGGFFYVLETGKEAQVKISEHLTFEADGT
jgi:hypothetical protein